MRSDLRYGVSDCFEPFPFPASGDETISAVAEPLYTKRAAHMRSHGHGLTTTYDELKDPACSDPEIVELRRLHEDLDRAVLAAYGCSDIAVPPYTAPRTPAEEAALEAFEDEVIDRLFALNAERAEKERLLGRTPTPGGTSGSKSKRHVGQ